MRAATLSVVIGALALAAAGCGGTLTGPSASAADLTTSLSSQPAAPLVFLDGRLVTMDRLRELDPGRIARIEVLKGPAAARLYGESGRGGVINVYLRR